MTDNLIRLLYITPPARKSQAPCDDELTDAMNTAFGDAPVTRTWRGWHTCACGERSTNRDYQVAGAFETNSLCVHYLRWHRDAVPARELNKVRGLAGLEPLPDTDDSHGGVTFLGRPISEWDPAELQQAMDELAVQTTWNPRPTPSRSVGLFQMRRPGQR